MCIQKCVRSKREGTHQGHKGRSRRNAYNQKDDGKGVVKLKHKINDFFKLFNTALPYKVKTFHINKYSNVTASLIC